MASTATNTSSDRAARFTVPPEDRGRKRRARRTRARHVTDRPRLLLRVPLVAGGERAPGPGADRTAGLPDHVELAVRLDLADHHRLPEVMVGLVHLESEPRGRGEGLAGHGFANVI